jgi:putative PIN family toxin of toxin-antitoxin system
MLRVVLDTNVLLAALGTGGLCADLVEHALERHVVVTSRHILRELEEHLASKFAVPEAIVRRTIEEFSRGATVVEPAELPSDVCSDPDDVPVLGTAVAGDAGIVVTGDKQLIRSARVSGVEVVNVREAILRLGV